jgi:hypothetical protein
MPTTDQVPRWRRWVLRHTPAPLLQEPFALWIALACFLAAAGQFLSLNEPSSIVRAMPPTIIIVWNIELLIGGLLTLAGIVSRRPRIIVLGLTPLGCGFLAYSVLIVAIAGRRSGLAAILTLSLGLACFVKSFVYSTAGLHITIGRDGDH